MAANILRTGHPRQLRPPGAARAPKGEREMTGTRRDFLKTAVVGAVGVAGFPGALRAQPREILVGETHPLTGGLAREGTLGKQGIELAVNEINAAGGVKALGGAKLKLMVLDNESKPPVAIS